MNYLFTVPKFWDESRLKLSSSFVKLFSPVSAYGEAMTYQKAEQQCYEWEKRTGEYLNCGSYHYADLIVILFFYLFTAFITNAVFSYYSCTISI